jgi:PAS domain S-box-containing protein
VLALLTTLGSLGLLLLARRATDNAVKVYRDRLLPIQQLVEVADAYTVDITFALRAVRGGQMTPAQGLDVLSRNEARALRAWARFKESRPISADLEAADACLTRLRRMDQELEGLLPAGPTPQLGIFGDAVWMPEVAELSLHLLRLREVEDRQAQVLTQQLESQSSRTTEWGFVLMVSVLALTLGFGGIFSTHLRRDTRRLLAHLRRVADGNLEPVPVASGGGELVWAEQELNRTVARLRQLMADLQNQQARYRLLAERLPDVVYQTQVWKDGRRAWPFVSPQFEAFYGVASGVLERDPDYSLRKIHPEDLPGFVHRLEEATRYLGPMDWEGRSFTERPGELKWIRVRRSPTQQDDGSLLWDGVLEDITKLKQSEEALRLSEARAQEASRAKSAFLASMSHELRTPLSAILGYTRLMAREPGRSEGDRVQLDGVLRAGEHLLALINDVLSLSKIEAGKMELRLSVFSPADLLHEMETLFRLSAQSKGLDFGIDVRSLPPQVDGDLPKLRQVLVNLLGNALKFTQRGSVRLVVSWRGDVGRFQVEDTGPGIAPEEQVEIFAAFHQTALGQAASGTGLGLHISQSLVSLMGGTLRLDSEVGLGARFSFELPLPQSEQPIMLPARGQVVRLADGEPRRNLLIVDDRPENRDLLERLLTVVGFDSRTAEQGAQGLELWRRQRPDLILMDLRMPVMNGFEAIQCLRREEAEQALRRTPVVAISASVYDVSAGDLIEHGFDAFLTKPIDEDQLFACLEKLLGLAFERRAPVITETEGSASLVGLAVQDGGWRARFLDQVASGDLEAAEGLLSELDDPVLVTSVRSALRAYHLSEILQHLR